MVKINITYIKTSKYRIYTGNQTKITMLDKREEEEELNRLIGNR